ncbi:hypothetical protein T484DRAFT_3634886 [Baffinella frigidus]|nr:hypothetical protein T484DRAFT_3634886 [Cryptophyta sp. CCMP2293]
MPVKRKGVAKKAAAKKGAGKRRAVEAEASESPTQSLAGEPLRGGGASAPLQGESLRVSDIVQLSSGSLCSRSDAEAELRKWDMQSCYGPCTSLSRKERWERATRLDLAPHGTLSRVGYLFEAFPDLRGNSVWHGLVCQEKFTGI